MELLRVKCLLYIDFLLPTRYKTSIGEIFKIIFDHWRKDISRKVDSMTECVNGQSTKGSKGAKKEMSCFLHQAGEIAPMCLHSSILEIIVASIL